MEKGNDLVKATTWSALNCCCELCHTHSGHTRVLLSLEPSGSRVSGESEPRISRGRKTLLYGIPTDTRRENVYRSAFYCLAGHRVLLDLSLSAGSIGRDQLPMSDIASCAANGCIADCAVRAMPFKAASRLCDAWAAARVGRRWRRRAT